MKLAVPFKIVGSIDTAVVNTFVESLQKEDFYHDLSRTKMGNLENTPSLVLRHSRGYIDRMIGVRNVKNNMTLSDFPLMPNYKKHIEAVLTELRKYYTFKDYAALLAMLPASKGVGQHLDGGAFLETSHRIHIPLVTNLECLYTIENIEWHMKRGIIYEIDNMRVHGVVNRGIETRIHLIINLYPHGYLSDN